MSRRAQTGFSLIEILVAFALLALGLTLLLGTLSGASRQLRQAGDAGRAALHAQSLLDARAGTWQPVREQGDFENGRYRWVLSVSNWYDRQQPASAPDPFAARLLRIQLRVEWGDGGPAEQLQVDTLRLSPPPESGR